MFYVTKEGYMTFKNNISRDNSHSEETAPGESMVLFNKDYLHVGTQSDVFQVRAASAILSDKKVKIIAPYILFRHNAKKQYNEMLSLLGHRLILRDATMPKINDVAQKSPP